MNPNVSKTLAASAVALLIAGCGGNSGSDSGAPTQNDEPKAPTLQVSGTAATGLALAGSAVEVKCAAGNGSATTDGNGAFTLTIADGALPCIIKVTGEVDGNAVTLHSVTESDNGQGTAIANVTPLTEMIVAQLTGVMPGDLFESFDAGSSGRVTQAELVNATAAVVKALKAATGIDLGNIDPFKSPLVAATAGAPDQGNAYDQMLDQLKEKVPTASLPLIVNQIAAASAAGSSNAAGPVTLDDIMSSVEGGSLAGCPVALSGKYRTLDYWGRSNVRQYDFKNMKVLDDQGQLLFEITADGQKPCEFVASSPAGGAGARFDMVIGPSGAGGYRGDNGAGGAAFGYLFPIQAHKLAAVTGTWNFLQSGVIPEDPVGHFAGQLVVGEDRKVSACDLRAESNFACEVDTGASLTIVEHADGGFELDDGGGVARLYGYRAPGGELTIFGTTNPTGATGAGVERTNILATRPRVLGLPEVGSISKYWNLQYSLGMDGPKAHPTETNATKILAVDAANGSYTRERASDQMVDELKVNHPAAGFRSRQAGTSGSIQFSSMYQFPVPSLGITVSVNAVPAPAALHFYSISVMRP